MLIWLKNQRKVRYRTFQLRPGGVGVDAFHALVKDIKTRIARALPVPDAGEAARVSVVKYAPDSLQSATKAWVANKRFEVSKFKFKFPRARTFELIRARSRLYKFRRASPSARLWWNLSSQ